MSDIHTDQKEKISNKAYWFDHIKKWEESELSQPVYCNQAGLKYSTFVYWRGLLATKPESANRNFIPLNISKNSLSSMESPKSIQIKLLSGHVVHIPINLDIKDIAALLCAIGACHA